MRKLKSLLVAIMAFAMVMAMSSVALAADNVVNTEGQTGTVTVYFTNLCTYSEDDENGTITYGWDSSVNPADPTLLIPTVGAQTVNIADLNGMVKGYEDGETNPFGTKVSVMDAIYYLGQNNKNVVTLKTGWGPAYGQKEAGFYVENVDNQELETYSEPNGDGTWTMVGTGFQVAIKQGNGEPTLPEIYVSNVALEDGMVIYVDLGTYSYMHQKLN